MFGMFFSGHGVYVGL